MTKLTINNLGETVKFTLINENKLGEYATI